MTESFQTENKGGASDDKSAGTQGDTFQKGAEDNAGQTEGVSV